MKSLHKFFVKEYIYKIVLFSIFLILITGYAISKFESWSFGDGVWWSIVTATTVGYGDISPKTIEGRCMAGLLMMFGISIMCMLTSKIASFMILTEIKGFNSFVRKTLKDHIIICNWNGHTLNIIRELRLKCPYKKIVILDDCDTHPIPHEDLAIFFQKGIVNEENLLKACIKTADTVIILGDSKLEHKDRDAKCVLDTLTVEHLNAKAYTIVELVDEKNADYCIKAKADEVISSYSLGSYLLSNTAVNHGISRVITSLLSEKFPGKISIVSCPEKYADTNIDLVIGLFKKNENKIVVGIINKNNEIKLNPSRNQVLLKTDKLIIIE